MPQIECGDRIVREPECRLITGLSRTTRWRLERQGLFPRRLRLSANAIGWRLAEVANWLASRRTPETTINRTTRDN